jgi:hypothetical protein
LNVLNRLLMILLSLLLIAVPVLLLLVNFGVIPADQANAYTGYRSALDFLGGIVSNFDFGQGTRAVIAAVAAAVTLIALFLQIDRKSVL